MLTFKHFADRPTWAAVAGYDYNIVDCMSVAAINSGNVIRVALGSWQGFLGWELREVPLTLSASIFFTIAALLYPLYFWIIGALIFIRCKRESRKYRDSITDTVRKNLDNWMKKCDRRFSK